MVLYNHKLKQAFLIAGLVVVPVADSIAQMSNQPYTFRNGSPSVGMSAGGKQAIINEKLYDATPRNLLHNSRGELLDVQEGPGQSAIIFRHGTNTTVPGYRTTFRDGRFDMSAGVFNTYFIPSSSGSSPGYASIGQMHGGATASTWTARVITGGPVSYLGLDNPVEVWTGQVCSMAGIKP